ncbi:MAG TPA: isoleucine--tRNA ligase [Cryomorphaceae bacterium]|nr:isoleucine--tRNA ligase [Cryomorphaceae bacterium]|tara:strand:- start:1480 stop:4926 length:3447 start_codon:yes stop_codon:yes gene_type:complete
MSTFPEYSHLDLANVHKAVLQRWKETHVFEQTLTARKDAEPWIFFEGPPSANGLPGIHHVMGRSLKDVFCRYKTQKGFLVNRKAGWDTHGLPVELGVEKELGITKEDIGKTISVEDYNDACKKAVMRYTGIWKDLTDQMGYWVDLDEPYVTYDPKYMESIWWLLAELFNKGLIYKGYTIQPYSPKAGTGLSSHELNQPGCYRDVKDHTVVAQFKMVKSEQSIKLFGDTNAHLLAWTTTPWTLPSNTALTVGPKIQYSLVHTFNQYTFEPVSIIAATPLLSKLFGNKFIEGDLDSYEASAKKIPYQISKTVFGTDLLGLRYEQLLPYALPNERPEDAFKVIPGDFVTTEDGTGIVHTAPTFGADDAKVAAEAGVPPLLVEDENGNLVPLVDLRGKFRSELKDEMFGFGDEYIKAEYLTEDEKSIEFELQKERLQSIIPDLKAYLSVDERIALKLKLENKAFKIEKYEHSYPHCWRTDKPVLYYPLDSWFIKSTAKKDRMIALNKTINWKPASTGTGRFGNWLENLNDWNLSRSRFWGVPLPIWSNEEGDERLCIGSVAQLQSEIEKSVTAGIMANNPIASFTPGDMSKENYAEIDLHRHLMDKVVLVSPSGKPMNRESDLIDVWFDSGAMPYAQWHYPFENKEKVEQEGAYPADFIAEGVDQTRGWFFTLHAISSMVFDKVAFKNVISNGLVLDKKGQKMSKRLGNAVDPFTTMDQYGADVLRWYLLTNASPWDNLRFDMDGLDEVRRKFFGTLHNTYAFFALYANVDGFKYEEDEIALNQRPEMDQWILSELHTLISQVEDGMESFEPTRAFRPVQEFTTEKLSNWYVRLGRRRFWKGDYAQDKISAYQTLWTCLETLSRLMAPLAPFYGDQLYADLYDGVSLKGKGSVHLTDFPMSDASFINTDLEVKINTARKLTSLVLSIRKKESLKVRQPLSRILVPVLNARDGEILESIKELLLAEVNVKELEIISPNSGVFVKKVRPNFKALGPKVGRHMKVVKAFLESMDAAAIDLFETHGEISFEDQGQRITIDLVDCEIVTEDIPGMLVATSDGLTVALDAELTEKLRNEGLARELVNRLQSLRKSSGLDVVDRINVILSANETFASRLASFLSYVGDEVLAHDISFGETTENETDVEGNIIYISISRI